MFYVYQLNEDYVFEHEFFHGLNLEEEYVSIHDGRLIIRKDYAWNGCSFKINIFDLFVFGTPEGILDYRTNKPKTYYASLVHDAIYQYKIIPRKDADRIFLEILESIRFRPSKIYYIMVRLFGWISYK